MASVELRDISKSFGARKKAVPVVRSLSLNVRDGELLVIVGPSGCGKTTLLRIIAGLEAPDSGEVLIGGASMAGVAPKDRDVAMVFQDYALYPHMTVRKNMGFGLKMRKTPRAEIDRRVGETARRLGIEHLLDRKPGLLSGGEQQRVALGRAVVREPNVFLLDEPLSNLDARLRAEMRREIKSLHRRLGTTMIYVTHDQDEAMGLAARIAVVGAGIVHQCAEPLDVYQKPADRYVADFMGAVPMSMMPVRIDAGGEELLLRMDEGSLRWPVERSLPANIRSAKSILAGFRPEGAELVRNECESGESVVRGCVQSIEPAGSRAIVLIDIGVDGPVACECAASVRPAIGDTACVRIDMGGVCLFDADTGRRISD